MDHQEITGIRGVRDGTKAPPTSEIKILNGIALHEFREEIDRLRAQNVTLRSQKEAQRQEMEAQRQEMEARITKLMSIIADQQGFNQEQSDESSHFDLGQPTGKQSHNLK